MTNTLGWLKLYTARTYNVNKHLVVTTHRWVHTTHVHLTAPRWCWRTLHRVRTTTVEKANAGTLDWCLSMQLRFPCTWRQQPSECRLHFQNPPQQAFQGTPGVRSQIPYSHTEWLPGECRLCFRKISVENSLQLAFEAPHAWHRIYCIPLYLNGKVY